MAVQPYGAGPEDWRELIRGEMARRGQPVPGQGAPRAFAQPMDPAGPMPPTQQPVARPPVPDRPPVPALDPDEMEAPPARVQPAAAAVPGKPREPGWLETIFGTINNGGGYFDERKEAMRKDALRDPASPESQSMRQRMGPMLQQLGLRGDEIAALSGEDIGALSGKGDLLAGVMEARQKAAASKTKATADAAAKKEERDYREGLTKEQREYQEGFENKKNAREVTEEGTRDERDFGQQKVIAALQSGDRVAVAKALADYNEQLRINTENRKTEAEQKKQLGKDAASEQSIVNFERANRKLRVSDPGTFSEINANTRARTSRQAVLSTATRALDASERLLEIDAEYAKIPMTERAGDYARSLAEEYDQLKNEHQGIILKIAGGGQGSAAEREEIKSGLPSVYNPFATAKLQGIERMLRLNVEATLAPYGISVRGPGESAEDGGAVDEAELRKDLGL